MAQQRALAPGGGVITVDYNPFLTPQPTWAQTDWYVDPINGSDTATGADANHAVKTIVGGVVSKWGTPSPTLGQNTTIHLLNTEVVGQEAVVLAPVLAGGVKFAIIGTPSAVGGTFSPSGVTAKNRATPQLLRLSGMPAAAAAGMLVHNLTHDSYAFVDSIAAGVATMTQPLDTASLTTVTTANEVSPTEVDTWAATDVYQLYTLPSLNLKVISPAGGDAKDNTQGTPVCWLQWIYVPDVSGSVGQSTLVLSAESGCSMVLSMCSTDANAQASALVPLRMMGVSVCCQHAGGISMENWAMVGGASNKGGSFPVGTYISGYSQLDGDVILHGSFEVLIVAGGYTLAGYVYLDAGLTLYCTSSAVVLGANYFASAQIWGPGTINLEKGGSIRKESGLTWAQGITCAIQLDASATGTSYAAGVFTDGRALNTANLDTYGGLQNPITGSRYANT